MATGYGATYRAIVIDNIDPMSQNRLSVNVPDIGLDAAWANPAFANHYESLPGVGDEVSVVFERADSDLPVWMSYATAQGTTSIGGYGVYRAIVMDNVDPDQANRLHLSVPDVTGYEPAWARPSSAVGSETPAVGSGVWVQYESGAADHPVWVGLQ